MKLAEHSYFCMRPASFGVQLLCAIIAVSATLSAAQPCAIPQYRIAKNLADADEVYLDISVPVDDLAPSRLACLAGALKKAYPGRSVRASLFTSDEAAQHYFPGALELSPIQEWSQYQLHGEVYYDKWDGEEYVKILPGGRGWDYDPRWDTRINLPLSGTPACTLAANSRCLLAFEPINYPSREHKRNGEGSVTVLGALQPEGSLKEVRAVDARASVPDQRVELVDYVLNNLRTWHFEPAARPEPFRITYRFSGQGWGVKFQLPGEVMVRCGGCGN
jgi:hypothetical protein